jgi:hypothetical protein
MANITINQLPEVLSLNPDTKFPIWQNDGTKTVKLSSITPSNIGAASAIHTHNISDINQLQSTLTTFQNASSTKWDSVYTTVQTNSATEWKNKTEWDSTYSTVSELSSIWEETPGYVWKTLNLNRPNFNGYASSIAYGNGLFVAVSDDLIGVILISSDGIVWREITVPESNAWQSVTYGNGIFVAVSSTGTNRIMISSDGINWKAVNGGIINSRVLYNITYGNGIFVIIIPIQTGPSTYRISAISKDGINWSLSPEVNFSTGLINSITYGNGLYVAVGVGRVAISQDGLNWTVVTNGIESNDWRRVVYGNGLFVAISNNGTNRIMTSSNGVDWTQISVGTNPSLEALTYGDGLFVAVAINGTDHVLTSTDGIVWKKTKANPLPILSISAAAYGNGIFVAIGGQTFIRSGKQIINDLEKKSLNITQGDKKHYGDLTVFGNISSSSGNILGENIKSVNWDSVYTTVQTNSALVWKSSRIMLDLNFDYSEYDLSSETMTYITNSILALPYPILMDKQYTEIGIIDTLVRFVIYQDYGGTNMEYGFDFWTDIGGGGTSPDGELIWNNSEFQNRITRGSSGTTVETIVTDWKVFNPAGNIGSLTMQFKARRTSTGTTRLKKIYLEIQRRI